MRQYHNVAFLCDGLRKYKRKCIVMRNRYSPGSNLLSIYRICAVLFLCYFIYLSHVFYSKRSTKLNTPPPFTPAEELVIKLDLISESILHACMHHGKHGKNRAAACLFWETQIYCLPGITPPVTPIQDLSGAMARGEGKVTFTKWTQSCQDWPKVLLSQPLSCYKAKVILWWRKGLYWNESGPCPQVSWPL